MKRSMFVLMALVGVFLSGCLVPSLHPLYTDNDVVLRPEIVGSWTAEDGDAFWDFELEPDSSYSLAYIDAGEPDTSWFTVHLVQLDSLLFMDSYPNPSDVLTDAYKAHLIAAHSFSKVEIDSDAITISVLDPDWLRRNIDSGRISVAHEQLGPDDLVLTATTEDLRKFVKSIANDSDAFSSVDLYRRIEDSSHK